MRNQTSSAGAKRRANAEFFSPPGSANQKEVRNIGASNEQNEPDRAKENQEKWLNLADDAVAQGNHHDLDGPVFLRISRGEPRINGIQFRLGLLRSNAGRKAADHRHPSKVAPCHQVLFDMQWHPNFRVPSRCELKFTGQDADDTDAFVVKPDRAANDVRVAAKTPHPAAIGENGDLRARSDIFASRKIAADERLDAER